MSHASMSATVVDLRGSGARHWPVRTPAGHRALGITWRDPDFGGGSVLAIVGKVGRILDVY